MSSPINMDSNSPINLQHQDTTSNPDSPPPELATMTNVNVLDLHKDYNEKDNTVYVYGNSGHNKIDNNVKMQGDQLLNARLIQQNNSSILQRITTGDQIIDGRLIQTISECKTHQNDQLTKIEIQNDQIFRVVEGNQIITKFISSNGETQIISREIINGEHHILTRNENGDHVITRIVNTEQKLINSPENDDVQYVHHTNNKYLSNSPTNEHSNGTIYTTNDPDHISTSVLHYTGDKEHIYATTDSDDVKSEVVEIFDDGNEKNKTNHIIYTHGDNKDLIYDGEKNNQIFSNDKQIDLIYEDGNKTVIYTTTADQKGLEIYSGNELGLHEGQVVVQGGLQYTQQTGQGPTVLVVSELVDGDLTGQIQR